LWCHPALMRSAFLWLLQSSNLLQSRQQFPFCCVASRSCTRLYNPYG
jgi:hypothetical protein